MLPNALISELKQSTMFNRRKFISTTAFTSIAGLFGKNVWAAGGEELVKGKPIVISTWDAGVNANKGAWEILKQGGRALDAVEAGVMVTESEQGCCVGLGANPDREG